MKSTHTPMIQRRVVAVAVAALLSLSSAPVFAQLKMSAPGYKADADIPPNTSPANDFEGIWWPVTSPPGGASPGKPDAKDALGLPPGDQGGPQGQAPDEGQVKLTGTRLQCAPEMRLNGGGGGTTVFISQSAKQLVMTAEEGMDIIRWVYIGQEHPANLTLDVHGHSVGHWEGNTLVVDTIGYDASAQSKGQHVVERISKSGNTLTSEATITDSNGKTRKQTLTWLWRPNLQFNESICEEDFDRYEVVDGGFGPANTAPDRSAK